MCGIIGAYRKATLTFEERKMIRSMLVAGTVRGFDSTGIAYPVDDGKAGFVKQAVMGPWFVFSKEVSDILDHKTGNQWIIGHNRAATQGAVNGRNAHPFQRVSEGREITMVHNGTLHGNTYGKFEVDSEWICDLLATVGLQETIDTIDGAYALVWHDSQDNSLNFIRNHERPLSIAFDPVTGAAAWASEAEMLTWMLIRHHKQGYKIRSLPTMTHLKIDVATGNVTEVFVQKKYRPVVATYHGRHNYHGYWEEDVVSTRTPTNQRSGLPASSASSSKSNDSKPSETSLSKKELVALYCHRRYGVDAVGLPAVDDSTCIGDLVGCVLDSSTLEPTDKSIVIAGKRRSEWNALVDKYAGGFGGWVIGSALVGAGSKITGSEREYYAANFAPITPEEVEKLGQVIQDDPPTISIEICTCCSKALREDEAELQMIMHGRKFCPDCTQLYLEEFEVKH